MNDPVNEFIKARDTLIKYRTDYELAYREFVWPKMRYFNWALDYFDLIAKDNHKLALWLVNEDGTEVKLSFSNLSERSNKVANFLRDLGVNRGDSILIMLDNIVPLWEVMLAGIKLGAILVPTFPLLNVADLSDRVKRSNVKHIIVLSSEAHKFENIAIAGNKISVGEEIDGWRYFNDAYQAATKFTVDQPTKPTEPLLLYFTSGTTDRPKLIIHTHQSYPVGHLSTMYWLGIQQGDIHWNISVPGWSKHSWSNLFAPWNAEATVFTYKYTRFKAREVLNILVHYQMTTMCAPPTVWRMLIQENLSTYPIKIRELCSAGEPLNAGIIEEVEKAWGVIIRDGYGQTETTALLGNPPGQLVKRGSMGKPLPGYKVTLLDEQGNEVKQGKVAVTLDSPPLGLMLGYKDFNAKIKEGIDNDHYLTGDIAEIDQEGYYTYIGRADDLFKASDYLISPFELESVLIKHDAVVEAAVIPTFDPIRLAVPKAFIVIRDDCQPTLDLAKAIFNYVKQHLSPHKKIRCLEFIANLPKTISGKIQRNKLRELESARRSKRQERENVLEFWENKVFI